MASNDPGPGGQLGDVFVPATVGGFGTAFPIARGSDLLGTHKSVTSLVDRDGLESNKRDEGMSCWVTATGELYRLVGGIANSNWILEASIGGANALIRTYLGGTLLNDVVYQTGVAGQVGQANAGAVATGDPLGVVRALDAPSVGQCIVVPVGQDLTGFAGLTIGARYILSTSSGLPVRVSDTGNGSYPDYLTPGSGEVLAPVGIATSATSLTVNCTPGIQTVG